jgi:hypothetical protein
MPIIGTAVMRAADAMLRALGGDQIGLVLPLPTETSNASFQLGLSDPGAQQVTLSPVVVRNLAASAAGPRVRLEFLLSAAAVANAVEAQGAASAEALFDAALAIQYQADLFHIERVSTDYFAGVAYLYHVVAVE